MVQVNGKLGNIGWELRAEFAEDFKDGEDKARCNYYICHPYLIDNSSYPNKVKHPVMYSLDNSSIENLRWHVDDVFLVKHPKVLRLKTRGTYDSSDLHNVTDALFYSFMKLTPKSDREFIKEMSCLMWLNNMNYSTIFSTMVRSSEESLMKYIKIMAELKNDYNHLEDFSQTAIEMYLLPSQYLDALI